MSFQDAPLIPTPALFRLALVSPTRGNRVVNQLRQAGQIDVVETPTHRKMLTVRHAELVHNALTNQGK